MTDLLVAGAGGQVGLEVARRAAAAGQAVAAFDRQRLDIADPAAVRAAVAAARPRVVVNAAAYTAVDKAESEPDLAFAVNRDGARHLAEAAAEAGAAMIHISTDYVFDGSKAGPYTEDDPIAPLGVYGRSKAEGEAAVRAAGGDHLILRTAWVYAAEGRNFVRTMVRLAGERDEVRVVDDQRGSPTAAGDLAAAIVALAGRIRDGRVPADGWGVFHAAGAGETTWCGFAREIMALNARHGGREPRVTAITTADFPTPARRPANSVLDCGRLARLHGLALRPWRDALAEVMAAIHRGA